MVDNRINRLIFHVDMDAFFTSIEQRDNTALQGKPVIVGSLPGNRGVVSAASYEARVFGVHSAMPINLAYKRCPQGIYLRPRMAVYVEESKKIMALLHSFTPTIEQISVDEAFMDMSGTEKLWGPPKKAAQRISEAIQKEIGLTASIGVANNKYCAKLASDLDKPQGITIVPFEEGKLIAWLGPLAVSRIWGVGKITEKALSKKGIQKIGELQEVPNQTLERWFGKQGRILYNLCRGRDERPMEEESKAKSISREHTFSQDCFDPELWRQTLLSLSREVAMRARKACCSGRTVVLTYRKPNFARHSRRITLDEPVQLARDIFSYARMLLEKESAHLKGLRLIGVGITSFDRTFQQDLFSQNDSIDGWDHSERAMDAIASRFGKTAIVRAGELKKKR